jgi:hypothetical protein
MSLRLSAALVLAFIFLLQGAPVRAEIIASMQLDVDQPITVIGRTPKLTIRIVNSGTNTFRADSLNCALSGSSIVQTSSFGVPFTVAAKTTRIIEVYYRAVSPGTTLIDCTLRMTEPATGQQHVLGVLNSVNVLSETRLYFDSYSATQVATVGQSIFLIEKFGNRGTTPFTNASINCQVFGSGGVVPVSQPQPPSTIQPGQNLFVESRWLAVKLDPFVPIDCTMTATDNTGAVVTLPGQRVLIAVK